jgi:molecular chaperone HtpG
MSNVETMQFQAESRELLDLMIHSVYSNKEIFLRELISNASDALDRLRFEALTNKELAIDKEDLHIRITPDTKNRTLTISDNGVGMSREEVISNIGTIARSGTRELLAKIKSNGKPSDALSMIGQFGIGFYSVFMVADKVELITRRVGEDKATQWVSDGKGEFTVSEGTRDTHGTTITLYLKPVDNENGIADYTNEYVISDIVKRYSDFISYPVRMEVEKKDKDDKTVVEDRTLNSMKPIWSRPESEVKEDEYNEFYRHISHDWNEPLTHISLKAEGTMEFHSLLYIPSKAPFDLFYQGYKSGLALYVRRVLIMENLEDLLPHYLRFVKGVVESADLPLNLSREMLQKDRHISLIKKRLVKKVLDTLGDMMEKDRDKYLTFWNEFGAAVKEGLTTDFENRDKLLSLLLYESTADPAKKVSFKEYIGRIKKEQNEIYYITGDSRDVLENSPHLEMFKKKGYEVLFMTDAVDELVVQTVTEFEGHKLKSVEKGEIDLGTEKEKEKSKKEIEEKTNEFRNLLDTIKKHLDENIKDVRFSNRLLTAPACIVTDENEMSPHLERLLKQTQMSGMRPKIKRILELNPKHPIIEKMGKRLETNKNDKEIKDYAELLMDYALLAEGSEIPDPVKFNDLLVRVMEKSL